MIPSSSCPLKASKSAPWHLAGAIAVLLSTTVAALAAPREAVITDTPSGRQGFTSRVEAPASAPNIIIVMTDDVGFGASSTFGGAIPTPNLDRLARNGLQYVNFHTTASCSPSRTADLVVPPDGASGTLVTQGGWFQGWGLLMRSGIPQFVYRREDMPEVITRLVAPSRLPPGRHLVAVSARRDPIGTSGTFTMKADGATVATTRVSSFYAFMFGNEPAVVGRDTGTMVDGDPYPFTWPAEVTVTVKVGPISIPSATGGGGHS